MESSPAKYGILARRLLELGHVTESQLSMAQREQKRTGEPLNKVLREFRFVSDDVFADTIAALLGLTRTTPKSEQVDRDMLKSLTLDFARKRLCLPLKVAEGSAPMVAMADPTDVSATDHVETLLFSGREPRIVVTTEAVIQKVLDIIQPSLESAGLGSVIEQEIQQALGADTTPAALEADSAPLIRLVDNLIKLGIREGTTDIHVEPEEKLLRIRFRIDGILQPGPTVPKALQNSVIARLKIMADLNISERRLPQDGRIRFTTGERHYDIRVSVLPTAHGENIVMRILDKGNLPASLELLGMPPAVFRKIQRIVENPYGMFLVTGPTGSGKSTTLYSSLGLIDAMEKKIVTVEDPIEYQLPLIRQSQVNPKVGYTFADGLRAILRQDPDVILVGEIRDLETAEMAIRAGLTGHFVLSTLHTNSAVGAIARLKDMGVEPFLINSSMLGVLAQRLVRRNCVKCREEVPVPEHHKPLIEAMKLTGPFYKGNGCTDCRGSGYKGRMGVYELFSFSEEARRIAATSCAESELRRVAQETGMVPLLEAGLLKAQEGFTTIDEVVRVIQQSDL
ncbi:MAG: GspE/PulE family protein [Planctomycetota bacterium]